MTTAEARYEVAVTFAKTTGKHYRGERDLFNVRAATEGAARMIIRRQLRGTGATITRTTKL